MQNLSECEFILQDTLFHPFFFPIQLTYSVLQCYFFWSFFEKYKSIRFPLKFWQLVIAIAFDQGPNIE